MLAQVFILPRVAYAYPYGAAVNYSVGDSPQLLFAADLSGDGVSDLAVPSIGTDSISVLINSGSGTFAAAVNYAVAGDPYAVFAADFDGDGDRDLAAPNYFNSNVSILLNNGAGTFASAVNYAAGTGPQAIFAANLNSGSVLDLAVANADSNNVSILLGNGSGTFASAVNYNVGTLPMGIVAADLDGDSDQDLAVTNYTSGNVSILLNNGSGVFASAVNYTVGSEPQTISAADFDGDSDQDLAVVNTASSNISILLNNGSGVFASAVNYTAGTLAYGGYAADLNADGRVDLAVANFTSDNVSILLGNGDGTFASAVNYSAGDGAAYVFGADFDGDSDQDLAVTNNTDDNVSILLSQSFVASVSSSGGAGLSDFVRRLQGGFAERYAARAYIPRDLSLRAEQCTSASCNAIVQFNSPKDAELERFALRHSENHRRIPFAAERNEEQVTLRFPWASNAELPVQLCYTHQNNAEFCVESRIWTPAAFAASEVTIEQLGRVKDQFLVSLRIPSFHNFSYFTSGKSIVLVEVYDTDSRLIFRQSVNRPEIIKLLLDPRRHTIRMTPVNAAGEAGEMITIPLDVHLLADPMLRVYTQQLDALWKNLLNMLNDISRRLAR
ncbi:MAG: VCBS repeat-containing protein [bacterium]|nr:VCBS repeat-containing protein [bacterium]